MIEVMSGDEATDMARLFEEAPRRMVSSGEHLFRAGDGVHSAFWIDTGAVSLRRTLPNGDVLAIHQATGPTLLAEASLFASAYHCDGIAETDAMVAVLPVVSVRQALCRSGRLATTLASSVAQELQALRTRVEILRLHRLADRLDAYLALYGEPPRGHWVRVAEVIGVTPPALYREVGRRRKRG